MLLLGDVGHCLSLVFLLLSLFIFIHNQSLHCGRVSVHINMFISIIFSNVTWLIWGHVVLTDSEIWFSNPIWCRMFNILMTYFTISTYFWMMCEGAYLQMVLHNTFSNDKNRFKLLLILGWILPVIAVAPYGFYRFHLKHNNCWMDLGESVWFIGVPVIIIMVVNVIMLVNVIIMIKGKIQQDSSSGNRRGSRTLSNIKQLTPLFVLFPVLGLHFFLVPARPEPKSKYEHSYDLLLTVSSSFQGNIMNGYGYHYKSSTKFGFNWCLHDHTIKNIKKLDSLILILFLGFTVSLLLCFLNKVYFILC